MMLCEKPHLYSLDKVTNIRISLTTARNSKTKGYANTKEMEFNISYYSCKSPDLLQKPSNMSESTLGQLSLHI